VPPAVPHAADQPLRQIPCVADINRCAGHANIT
jgi:hypothetical protein